MKKVNIGILGLGRFGRLWAEVLAACSTPFNILGYDINTTSAIHAIQGIHIATLHEVAKQDIIFLTVPISNLASCCQALKPHLRPESLIVDCCSVKIYTAEIMQRIFSSTQPLIGSHPLFGPDSVSQNNGSCAGYTIALCPLQNAGELLTPLQSLLTTLGLQIVITTPDQHDQDMAYSQALVHFIGRGLKALHLQPQKLATPDFNALLHIQNMAENDSWDLFIAMQRHNPYAQAMRKKLLQSLTDMQNQFL